MKFFGGAEVTEAHDRWLEQMFSKVGKRDQLFILGDVTVSKEDYALEFLKRIPGRKHLISGNHDPTFAQHSGSRAATKKWLDSGVFETIAQHGTVKAGGEKVLLSHFPYLSIGDGLKRDGIRYQQWRLPDYGMKLLHGHTHSPNREEGARMLNVGVDAWKRLVSVDDVAEWVKRLNQGSSIPT